MTNEGNGAALVSRIPFRKLRCPSSRRRQKSVDGAGMSQRLVESSAQTLPAPNNTLTHNLLLAELRNARSHGNHGRCRSHPRRVDSLCSHHRIPKITAMKAAMAIDRPLTGNSGDSLLGSVVSGLGNWGSSGDTCRCRRNMEQIAVVSLFVQTLVRERDQLGPDAGN